MWPRKRITGFGDCLVVRKVGLTFTFGTRALLRELSLIFQKNPLVVFLSGNAPPCSL